MLEERRVPGDVVVASGDDGAAGGIDAGDELGTDTLLGALLVVVGDWVSKEGSNGMVGVGALVLTTTRRIFSFSLAVRSLSSSKLSICRRTSSMCSAVVEMMTSRGLLASHCLRQARKRAGGSRVQTMMETSSSGRRVGFSGSGVGWYFSRYFLVMLAS